MFAEHPILLAILTGFTFGLLLSIPVGPINLTIMNEGARRGFKWAIMIGLGAVVMEVIYCAVAFTGFASIFSQGTVKAAMELFSFVFMLFLGVKFILAKSVESPTHLTKATTRFEERIEDRFHPTSAFWIGFVRVMGNPGVLLFWIILAANFVSREWVQPNGGGKVACISGVAVGCGLWFFALSYAVSRGRGKLSEKTLLRMEHFSGYGLLTLAIAHGLHIIWQMAQHRM